MEPRSGPFVEPIKFVPLEPRSEPFVEPISPPLFEAIKFDPVSEAMSPSLPEREPIRLILCAQAFIIPGPIPIGLAFNAVPTVFNFLCNSGKLPFRLS